MLLVLHQMKYTNYNKIYVILNFPLRISNELLTLWTVNDVTGKKKLGKILRGLSKAFPLENPLKSCNGPSGSFQGAFYCDIIDGSQCTEYNLYTTKGQLISE